MNWRKVLTKAAVTSLQAATGALIAGGTELVQIAAWEAALLGGLGGLVTFVHRSATEWLAAQETPPQPRRRRPLQRDRIPEVDPGAS